MAKASSTGVRWYDHVFEERRKCDREGLKIWSASGVVKEEDDQNKPEKKQVEDKIKQKWTNEVARRGEDNDLTKSSQLRRRGKTDQKWDDDNDTLSWAFVEQSKLRYNYSVGEKRKRFFEL